MMAGSKSPRARLLHIRDEIDGVAMIVRNLSFAQYQGSYLHRRAVERAAQIVSEAAKALSPDYLAKSPMRHGLHCRDRQYLAARVPAPRRQAALGNSDRSPAQIAADRDANAGGTRQITRCVRLLPPSADQLSLPIRRPLQRGLTNRKPDPHRSIDPSPASGCPPLRDTQ